MSRRSFSAAALLVGLIALAVGAAQAADSAHSVLLLPDGKIVAGGRTDLGSNVRKGYFALARYKTDGSLDTSFGRKGKVATPLGVHFGAGINALALRPDGTIVAGGDSYNGRNYDFALIRYKADGSVDTSFGRRGKVTTDFIALDSIRGIALQQDGKIVAAGVAGGDVNEGGGHFALARYTASGSLDKSFGSGGKVQTKIGSESSAAAVLLQSGGKIVAAGSGNGSFALARYKKNGSLDKSFGTAGIVTTSIGSSGSGGNAAALQSNGKIVVAGFASGGFALARYSANGSLDAISHVLGPDRGAANAVLLQLDGKIVAAGWARQGGSSQRLALARYKANGLPDSSFGTGGEVTTGFGAAYAEANAIGRQANGKLVVAGDSGAGKNFVLARYNGNGSLDSTFGSGGKVVTSFTVCAVPALKGLKLSAAKRAITNARCSVGKVSGTGRVVSQKPAPGTWHKIGTKVSFVLQ